MEKHVTFEAFQASRRRVDRLGDHTRYINDYEEGSPGLLKRATARRPC